MAWLCMHKILRNPLKFIRTNKQQGCRVQDQYIKIKYISKHFCLQKHQKNKILRDKFNKCSVKYLL